MPARTPSLAVASPPHLNQEQPRGPLRPAQREKLLKLTNKSEFFRKLNPSVLAKLPEIAHCESKPAGSLVFSQGDTGHHCYVVLSGRVGVWVEMQKQAESSSLSTPRSSGASSASTCCNSDTSCASTSTLDTCSSGVESQLGDDDVHGSRRPSLSDAGGQPSFLDPSRFAEKAGCQRGNAETVFVKLTGEPMPNQVVSRRSSVGRRNSAAALPSLMRKESLERESDDEDGKSVTQVGSLGAGAIFGELALLHDQPRTATIICSEDTELILVERADFDELLKADIVKSTKDKEEFLQAYCPGMKKLPSLNPVKQRKVLFGFEKATFPKGHVFFEERTVAQAGIFIVSSGCAELRSNIAQASAISCSSSLSGTRSLPGPRSLGVLMKGAIFGSALPGLPEVCSAVATTQCEVFYSTGAGYRHMPRSVRYILREALAETMTRRLSVIEPPRTPSSTSLLSLSRPSTASRPSTPTRILPCTSTNSDRLVGKSNAGCLSSLAGRNAFVKAASSDSRLRTASAVGQSGLGGLPKTACSRASSRQEHERCSSVSVTPKRQGTGFAATVKFNADMEICRKFGGNRLRVVRNFSGTRSAPSIVEQMEAFRRK